MLQHHQPTFARSGVGGIRTHVTYQRGLCLPELRERVGRTTLPLQGHRDGFEPPTVSSSRHDGVSPTAHYPSPHWGFYAFATVTECLMEIPNLTGPPVLESGDNQSPETLIRMNVRPLRGTPVRMGWQYKNLLLILLRLLLGGEQVDAIRTRLGRVTVQSIGCDCLTDPVQRA